MSLQPEPETHPVARAKAPWPLKAESYLLFLNMKELPKGVYDKLEEVWEGEEYGTFKGGLGAVMIVRYSDTPVGTSFHVDFQHPPSNPSIPLHSTDKTKAPTTNSFSSPETSPSPNPLPPTHQSKSQKKHSVLPASTSRSAQQHITAA